MWLAQTDPPVPNPLTVELTGGDSTSLLEWMAALGPIVALAVVFIGGWQATRRMQLQHEADRRAAEERWSRERALQARTWELSQKRQAYASTISAVQAYQRALMLKSYVHDHTGLTTDDEDEIRMASDEATDALQVARLVASDEFFDLYRKLDSRTYDALLILTGRSAGSMDDVRHHVEASAKLTYELARLGRSEVVTL